MWSAGDRAAGAALVEDDPVVEALRDLRSTDLRSRACRRENAAFLSWSYSLLKAMIPDPMSAPERIRAHSGASLASSDWCPEEDSNLHGVTRQYLKLVRLPIPPSGRGKHEILPSEQKIVHQNQRPGTVPHRNPVTRTHPRGPGRGRRPHH